MGVTHFDDAVRVPLAVGHIDAHWTLLGEGAGCETVGVRRIEVAAGSWSTPAHEHGREEEIFYVLGGRGLTWNEGSAAPIAAGDCIVHVARGGAHTLHAIEPLDVLAFGPREHDESPCFPRLGFSLLGGRWVQSAAGRAAGLPIQFAEEAKLGPPELPDAPGERPASVANVADVEPRPFGRGRVDAMRRNLGVAAGSRTTGLKHIEVAPGKESAPLHCHSVEEEIFVVLDGDGLLVLEGEEEAGETAVRAGSVVARPAGTGVSHLFRAGASGLALLAYGPRHPADVCYYPRSNKISFRGVGVIGRIERLDYWDGEG
jgi:uncharacterized cupin superfamily protein